MPSRQQSRPTAARVRSVAGRLRGLRPGTTASRLSAGAAALVLAATTSACASSASASAPGVAEPAPGAVAFVLGARAGAPVQRLAGQALAAQDLAVTQGSAASVVVADGAPYVSFTSGQTAVGTTDARDRYRNTLTAALSSARARTPETDLLGALRLAGQGLASHAGLHTVVVADSGLSTAGVLDFTRPGLLDADPGYVADSLGDQAQVPDLSGAMVVFQGLGQVAAPQPALDPARLSRLQAIWRAVAERSGAVGVDFEPAGAGEAPSASLPAVRTVAARPDIACSGRQVVVSGGRFAFPPESDILLDQAAARQALQPLAAQIVQGHLTAILDGGVPSLGTPEGRAKLSENQAQAVANQLLALGVLIPQLHVEGLGSTFPGFVPDHDAAGHLDPAAAALDTRVTIRLSGPVTC